MPTPAPSRVPSGAPGSARARLRLGAVILMALLAVVYLVLAVRLYFFPSVSPVVGGILGTIFAGAALACGLLTKAVVRQSRVGHILAAVACATGAVLSASVAMAWLDWATLGVNAAAFGLLLGCVPRKAPAAS